LVLVGQVPVGEVKSWDERKGIIPLLRLFSK